MSFGREKNPADRRQFGRRETSYAAWIRIAGRPSQACVVRNLSLGGALLACDYPRILPFRFELQVPALGATFQCEARHCTDTTLGVEFLQPDAQVTINPPSAAVPRSSGAWETTTVVRPVRRAQDLVEKMKNGA